METGRSWILGSRWRSECIFTHQVGYAPSGHSTSIRRERTNHGAIADQNQNTGSLNGGDKLYGIRFAEPSVPYRPYIGNPEG